MYDSNDVNTVSIAATAERYSKMNDASSRDLDTFEVDETSLVDPGGHETNVLVASCLCRRLPQFGRFVSISALKHLLSFLHICHLFTALGSVDDYLRLSPARKREPPSTKSSGMSTALCGEVRAACKDCIAVRNFLSELQLYEVERNVISRFPLRFPPTSLASTIPL